jgi:hypothetical protein
LFSVYYVVASVLGCVDIETVGYRWVVGEFLFMLCCEH